MSREAATGRGERTNLGLRLAGECMGLSLIEADTVLDNARRYVWLRSFSGASNDALDREIAGVPNFAVSRRIVDHLDGIVTHMEAEQVFLEARLALWMQTFARVPNSLFAQQWQAYHERLGETVLQ